MANAWDKPHKAIENILGTRTVFYSVDADIDEFAVEGKVIFTAPADEFWAVDEESKPYESHIVTDPTWLDVAILAEVMIQTTGDYHHIFLEGIHKVGNDIVGTPIYHFTMGS